MHPKQNIAPDTTVSSLFQNGGEMGALMRAFDWHAHPLGNPEHWPESLKNNIRLLLNSGFPMFIWWSEELFMFHNDAYLPALGNKHPAALGAKARVMWAEIWDDLGVVVDNILRGGDPFFADALPLTLERKGFPEETYWTFSYSPAFNDNGSVNGIFCACTEVTNTVLNQRRLKSLKEVSEEMTQLQTMEQASQRTCNLLYQNKEDIPFCAIYLLNNTVTTATLLGKAGNIADAALPATINLANKQEHWALTDELALQQMAIVDCAHVAPHNLPDNEINIRIKQAAVLPIMRPGQNQAIGLFITGISPKLVYNAEYRGYHALLAGQMAISITSVQAREELARQQQVLKEVFQQAPVGITILRGPNHRIDLANPGICEMWGREAEEVLGIPVIEALPEVADQGIMQLLDGVFTTGEAYIANELPVQLERQGELETLYFNFIYHPLRDSQGLIQGVIAVAIDISQQVKYRQSIEALNEELLITNADLDNFVYAASHDLKTPILNIEGLIMALVEDLPEAVLQTDDVTKVIDLIKASVRRFKRTVTDLSEVAKIQRQAGQDISQLNIAETVAEVRLDFESQITASGAQIETDFAPDGVIQFSAKNLRSIIYNLLSNALKYRAPVRKPYIIIKTETTPEYVMLLVQDNGLGMDMSQERKIFSMFSRLHDHVEGTGVGLYIVKRIVENAGGFIQVESTVGTGTTFRIYFKR
ncbi:sensor histidine kinase [Adhaeribacter rhizoryzae]|nr:ATP-binding protein [Adhaeribacter rhizoryzae]